MCHIGRLEVAHFPSKKREYMWNRHHTKGQLGEYFILLYQQQDTRCAPVRALTFKNYSTGWSSLRKVHFLIHREALRGLLSVWFNHKSMEFLSSYLRKLWRCDPFSTPRVGRTHQPVSRHPVEVCCSPCPPRGPLRTLDPDAGLARLRTGCRRAALRPGPFLLIHVAALKCNIQNRFILDHFHTFHVL